MRRFFLVSSWALALMATGCEPSQKSDVPPPQPPTPPARPTPPAPVTTASAGDKDSAQPAALLIGRWVRADGSNDDTFYWQFTADEHFLLGFESPAKAHADAYPETLRGPAKSYFGVWKLDGDTLVLSSVTTASETKPREARVKFERGESADEIKIDNVALRRK